MKHASMVVLVLAGCTMPERGDVQRMLNGRHGYSYAKPDARGPLADGSQSDVRCAGVRPLRAE